MAEATSGTPKPTMSSAWPLDADRVSASRIAMGEKLGQACSTRAAAPAMSGVAKLVPSLTP